MTARPGWYPDPRAETSMLRWWDGERWTDHARAIPTRGSPSFWRPAMIVLTVVGLVGTSVVLMLIVLSAMLNSVRMGNK